MRLVPLLLTEVRLLLEQQLGLVHVRAGVSRGTPRVRAAKSALVENHLGPVKLVGTLGVDLFVEFYAVGQFCPHRFLT